MVAGIMSARNHYIQQRGIAIGRALRTHNGQARIDMLEWLEHLYGTQKWTPSWHRLEVEDQLLRRTGRRNGDDGMGATLVPEQWAIHCLPKAPNAKFQDAYSIPSV